MKKSPRDYRNCGKLYSYILDSITPDIPHARHTTDSQRIEFILHEFYGCCEDRIKRANDKNLVPNILSDWLRSYCHYPYLDIADEHCKIIEIGTRWGYCRTDARASLFVRTWYDRIAKAILRLAKIYGIDTSHLYRTYTYTTVEEVKNLFYEYCEECHICVYCPEINEIFFDFTDMLLKNGDISEDLCDTATL